eukprot:365598-Chlamydomonas_euryale.AAC.14
MGQELNSRAPPQPVQNLWSPETMDLGRQAHLRPRHWEGLICLAVQSYLLSCMHHLWRNMLSCSLARLYYSPPRLYCLPAGSSACCGSTSARRWALGSPSAVSALCRDAAARATRPAMVSGLALWRRWKLTAFVSVQLHSALRGPHSCEACTHGETDLARWISIGSAASEQQHQSSIGAAASEQQHQSSSIGAAAPEQQHQSSSIGAAAPEQHHQSSRIKASASGQQHQSSNIRTAASEQRHSSCEV